ncbi:MAG: hypothetical protein RX318_04575 [bacterium]|nr:hypothetical protein [bacterium]
MNGSMLLKIHDGRVAAFLNCDSHEQQKVLEPILLEIRRVVEEALGSVKAGELAATFGD